MGVNVFPSGGGGSPIKSIQRGVASSAGNITISAVNTAKTMVRSFSTGSSGTVAATGSIGSQSISASVAAHNLSIGGGLSNFNSNTSMNAGWRGGIASPNNQGYLNRGGFGWANDQIFTSPGGAPVVTNTLNAPAATWPIAAASIPGNISATNITGGTTSLTSAEFGIYLVNSTTITATGACRWEVIEFN